MDLTALQDRCAFRYRDTTNRLVQAAEWTDYLNDAYSEVIGSDPNWPFLQTQNNSLTVTAGSAGVTLPTDGWRVTSVYNSTDLLALTPIPGQAEFRRYFPEPDNDLSIPLFYRLRSNTLEVYPRPSADTDLSIEVLIPPADLSVGTDVPVFPAQYHRALVAGALSKAYEDDGDDQRAAIQYARFDRILDGMRKDLLSPRMEGYPEVVDTF